MEVSAGRTPRTQRAKLKTLMDPRMSDPQLTQSPPHDLNLQERPGCLSGLLKLFLLHRVYDWLQDTFGFGRGCMGVGCGVIFFVLFVIFACWILGGTNWFRLGF